MLGIMGAMDIEVRAIRTGITDAHEQTILGYQVTTGQLENRPVALVRCGVGKVNAAVATVALAQLGVSGIVFTGMAGGVGEGVEVGDAVVATDFVQHDIDATAMGFPPGSLLGDPGIWPADRELSDAAAAAAANLMVRVHRGRIASGDQFIASTEKSSWIREQFGAVAVEMEGAAVAQVAQRLGVPLAVLRWISDTADHHAAVDFPAFTKHIAELDLAVLSALLAG